MMRRWIFPILAGAVLGAGAYQATLLATPYALMQAAMMKVGKQGPANQFAFAPMTTAENQTIVRPSPDLSYSVCAFDVSKGPVLVDVQPVPGYYWSVSVFDARTDVAAVRSDRDTKGASARLALMKQGQTAPAGYDPVRVGYDRGLVLIRILVAPASTFPTIDAIRRKSTCKQL
ncbi:MAG: hypothetical protein B7Y62_00735 [Sphingomonadales bacterium 35-56-22]|jgi:uncharacterized membrane protein|uniref:DUF1254 domain-containing protein n=1 Tax=Sphingorhabdus sp. TaxID=1902408 RepID=UPI000BC522A6|nr:DUF1254 domain-containing protein [Sphingorhabdus sp.]OYY16853.1 MAG: hypothetical protein B7Y62_00735 [Sphingomonadales bacterium 35-56-22]OYY99008.1 MAG: hypothetical protein B7Y38_00735 [Sphingomonadales bacterium 28-56-43]OYZ61597.1 MAG: hypothetical protein B7Y10_02190 [Sphingomonadales bacterium 24-56-14]OZA83363.1 MAG: hypothetical protein B7X66_04090 [Sphingomonadales bacterium 39-57-19]HQS12280.1 DUF1254 domain-containing protein [Sphingorhabdus sp.]